MIDRERLSQIAGFGALVSLSVGAGMYATKAQATTVMWGAFVLGALLLLALAIINARSLRSLFGRRSARHGANMVVMIVLFACIAIVVQAISARNSYWYDVTENRRFTLAPQTSNILENLQDEVRVVAFFTQGSGEQLVAAQLLEQYGRLSDKFRHEFVDPDRDPQRALDAGVKNSGTTIVSCLDRREALRELTEESLTNAILRVVRAEPRNVYFVVGHGEKDIAKEGSTGYTAFVEAAQRENYEVKELSLFEAARVPEDADVVVIAGPERDYFREELSKLRDYLHGGGDALVLMDPHPPMPNLEELLGEYGVLLEGDLVIDPNNRIFAGNATVPVVTELADHPIMRPINMAIFFPIARSVHIAAKEEIKGVSSQYLALASSSAWGEMDADALSAGTARRGKDDITSSIALALIATKRFEDGVPTPAGPDISNLVVVGDSDFANNSTFGTLANGDFILNTIGYLAAEKDLVAIRPKPGMGDQIFLTASQGRFIFLICVVALPLTVLSYGITVFVRRRRNA